MKSNLSRFFHLKFAPSIPAQFAGKVRLEQIDTLANLGGAIGCIGVLAAGALFVSFWNQAPHWYLSAFITTFVFVYAAAFRRSIKWRKQVKPKTVGLKAYRIRNLHVGVIGALWSTMPISLVPYADANQMLLIVYVTSGIIASSVVIAPTFLAAFLISAPVAAGTFLAMLFNKGSGGPMIGVLILIYTTLVLVSTLHSYRSFIQRAVSRMELEEQREVVGLLLHEFEEEANDWLWRTDANGQVERITDRMADIWRQSGEALQGRRLITLFDQLISSRGELTYLADCFEKQTAFRDVLIPVSVDSRQLWWKITGKPLYHSDGSFNGYCGVVSDVTAAEASRLKIAYMATHDSLTGLPNRANFLESLERTFATCDNFALFWADLDQFKSVNDVYGHAVGDALLVAVSTRLCSLVDENVVVARLSGDEFVVLQRKAGFEAAEILAQQLIKLISAHYQLHDHRIEIGVSLGVAFAPNDALGPEAILKCADLALYRAKEEGRGIWRFFEPEMDARAREMRSLKNDLRHASGRGELSLMFQPIIDLSSSRVSVVEALLRWNHPQRGFISPESFIPLAEQTGAILAMGEWVLRQACEEAVNWPDDIRIAVNVSPVQLRDVSLSQTIDRVLAESGLSPERLELEITESVFLDADASVLGNLRHIREKKISFALDDFGTGYSSLSYLRSFPFDKVKIDKSFIRDIAAANGTLALVRAIVGMARSLAMTVTAEGVETEEQLSLVKAEGCSLVQGYLFSRPVSSEQIGHYVRHAVARTLEPVTI